jgi:hypothetical protein
VEGSTDALNGISKLYSTTKTLSPGGGATERSALRTAFRGCWIPPSGLFRIAPRKLAQRQKDQINVSWVYPELLTFGSPHNPVLCFLVSS